MTAGILPSFERANMNKAAILDNGQKRLLRLIADGSEMNGWTPVSSQVFPLIEKMPQDLVEFEHVGNDGHGRVRLTPDGKEIIKAMSRLGV